MKGKGETGRGAVKSVEHNKTQKRKKVLVGSVLLPKFTITNNNSNHIEGEDGILKAWT